MTRSPSSSWLIAACLTAGLAGGLQAQQTPPPVDPKALLSTLKDLRTKQVGILAREKSDVLAAINAALADPAKAYEKAVDSVELQGQPTPTPKPTPGPGNFARNGTHVLDTRKHVGEQVRDRDFLNGLRLQLTYLKMTWQHSMGAKPKDLLPALLDYVGQVNQDLEALQLLDMFPRSINDSVFVAYFQIGPYISGLPDWSDHPFNTDSIYQQTILPEMRRNKDPRLLNYWDNLIQTEGARATATQNSLLTIKFNHIRRPSLLWSRAQDELILGNTNQGMADMLADLRANPDHPDFDKWAAQLEELAKAKLPPPAGEVTVGPATAPETPAGSP